MTDAITRQEKLLAGVSIKPITREEMFLAKLAGQNVNTPEPITRKEKLMQRIIDNGISGGGDEFAWIKFSDFTGLYGEPKVADMRAIKAPHKKIINCMFQNCFYNYAAPNTNGYYVELKDVYIPDWIVNFNIGMFKNCANLQNIYGNAENVYNIDAGAFEGCSSLKDVPYMPKLSKIENNGFARCKGLTRFNFYMTATSITDNAFSGCTNLLDIYVPWGEGEVKNAPWGAKNATIHYNTVYDENHEPIV